MFKIPENIDSKYRFVILSAMRAEQLQTGAMPRLKAVSAKPTVVAQEEVASGLVEPWDPSTAPEELEAQGEPAEE